LNLKAVASLFLPTVLLIADDAGWHGWPAFRAESKKSTLRILAVGDINLGRELGRKWLLRGQITYPFEQTKGLISSADIAFANLESPLSDQRGITEGATNLIFTGPPEGADSLAYAGFDVVSTANNHAWDFGLRALRETIQNLRRVGIRSIGTGETLEEAYAPAVIKKNGWRIAFFAVTHVLNGSPEDSPAAHHIALADPERLRRLVNEASRRADLIVLSYHGGTEYTTRPTPETERFARAMIEAGVDIFLGHHPHVLQKIEWYRGHPILYSLGNFVFRQSNPRTRLSFAALLTIAPDGRIGVECLPIIADYQPRFAEGEKQTKILDHLLRLSRFSQEG